MNDNNEYLYSVDVCNKYFEDDFKQAEEDAKENMINADELETQRGIKNLLCIEWVVPHEMMDWLVGNRYSLSDISDCFNEMHNEYDHAAVNEDNINEVLYGLRYGGEEEDSPPSTGSIWRM